MRWRLPVLSLIESDADTSTAETKCTKNSSGQRLICIHAATSLMHVEIRFFGGIWYSFVSSAYRCGSKQRLAVSRSRTDVESSNKWIGPITDHCGTHHKAEMRFRSSTTSRTRFCLQLHGERVLYNPCYSVKFERQKKRYGKRRRYWKPRNTGQKLRSSCFNPQD